MVDLKSELAQWDQQLNNLKRLLPIEVNYSKLIKDEIPAAEEAVRTQEDKLAPAKAKSEEVRGNCLLSITPDGLR
jgi:DNA repair protein RAD50